MGKSQKPLTILCSPEISEWEEVQKLSEQGHTIVVVDRPDADLILYRTSWRMDPTHRKYLPLAVAAARKLRYPKEK